MDSQKHEDLLPLLPSFEIKCPEERFIFFQEVTELWLMKTGLVGFMLVPNLFPHHRLFAVADASSASCLLPGVLKNSE